jgi:hypothetical protein
VTKPVSIATAVAPLLIKLALAEIDNCIERLRSVRSLLAQQSARLGQDTPTAQVQQETEE